MRSTAVVFLGATKSPQIAPVPRVPVVSSVSSVKSLLRASRGLHPQNGKHDLPAKWDNLSMSNRDVAPTSVHVLGAVYGVTLEGSIVDVPSASQRRLLGILAVHAPRQLRTEWLADVLDVTTGALRTTVSRLRTTIGAATLRRTSTGYSLEGDVDAVQFCSALASADKTTDRLEALEQALVADNLGRRLGTELFDEQRSVSLEGP